MTRSEIESLQLPTRTKIENMYGNDVLLLLVKISDKIEVEVIFDSDDKAGRLLTRSPDFETETGARVGDTLQRLRELYSNGRVTSGAADGLFFQFSTGLPDQYFFFDAYDIGRECVVDRVRCPADLELKRAIDFRVG